MAFTLSGILSLNNSSFMNSIREATGASDNFGNKINGVGSKLKGLAIGAAGFGGLALGVKDTVKTFMDFQKEMSNVQALTEASPKDLASMSEKAKEMGRILPASASDAAKAMANLGSAGFSTDEIMKSVEGTLYLATSAQTDMATAADITSGTLRGFGIEAEKAGHVSDVLAMTAAKTNAGILDTGEAMKYAAPVAHSFGISMEETSAAIGLMANNAIKGSQAGTTLRTSFVRLAKPAKPASEAMSSIGFSAFDSAGKMKSLSNIIGELNEKTKGMTEENKNATIATIFGTEALSGMLALMKEGPDKIDSLTKSLEKSDGASKKMAETQTNNLYGAMQSLEGAFETAKINIGEKAAPALTEAIKSIADAIPGIGEKIVGIADNFVKFATKSETAKTFMKDINGLFKWIIDNHGIVEAGIIGIATAFVTAKTIMVGAGIIKTVGEIIFAFSAVSAGAATAGEAIAFLGISSAAVFAGIAAGVAILAYEIYTHWDGIKTNGVQMWTDIGNSASDAVAFIMNAFIGLANWFTANVTNPIKSAWNELNDLWGGADLTMTGMSGYNEYKGRKGPGIPTGKYPFQANGTAYSLGGLTHINERGGELQLLRNGTAVIPADKTDRLLEGSGMGGNTVIIQNLNYGNEMSYNTFISKFSADIRRALANS